MSRAGDRAGTLRDPRAAAGARTCGHARGGPGPRPRGDEGGHADGRGAPRQPATSGEEFRLRGAATGLAGSGPRQPAADRAACGAGPRGTGRAGVAAALGLLAAAFAGAPAGASDNAAAADAVPLAQQVARTATQEFGGTLKRTLTDAMAAGGPENAIPVCADKAPEIAEVVGERHGVNVSRTSLKPRNAGNAPTDWQRDVLERWQAAVAAGTDPAGLEFFEPGGDGGFRYMKSIVAAPLCVTCHGQGLAPSVQAAIDARYPADQATGYATGDLRGAFVVTSVGD